MRWVTSNLTLFNFEGLPRKPRNPRHPTKNSDEFFPAYLRWEETFKKGGLTREQTCEYGGVAQLGEHLPCKQGVDSSILFVSTSTGWLGSEPATYMGS